MPKEPATVMAPNVGKPHLKGSMGRSENQGAAAIKSILPSTLAAFPSGIRPVKVPIIEASQPVIMARRTGNSRKTFAFLENTWE